MNPVSLGQGRVTVNVPLRQGSYVSVCISYQGRVTVNVALRQGSYVSVYISYQGHGCVRYFTMTSTIAVL